VLEAARRQSFQSYERFWKDLAKERPNAFTSDGALHQVGGVGHPWQDPVEVDCVKYADDDYHNHPMEKAWFDLVRSRDAPPNEWPDFEEQWEARSAFTARERVTHFARADSWQLVLQIESDSEVGPWTLEGCLYVCIRKSDLAERRFDRCWTISQCT